MHHRQRRTIFLLKALLGYTDKELHQALEHVTGETSLQDLPVKKAAKFIRYLLRTAGLPAYQDISLTLDELKVR